MLVSEWAERNRVLPVGTTARPGAFIAEKFQRVIMDAVCDPVVRRVSFQKGTQIGWTDAVLLNIIGYYIDVDPKPMMLVFVRDSDAKDKSKKTIAPMIAECASLSAKVRDNKSREGGNTQQLKQFPGGFLKIAGANSAANLRSDPCAIILLDEADGYPDDVDGEGDPVVLAERRADTFDDSKILIGSTPAKPKGISRIEKECERGNQTYFHVPCPHCGKLQALMWRDPDTKEFNIFFDKDAEGMPIPETVRYRCKHCREGIHERFKQQMLDAVVPVAKFPERREHISFYINTLYANARPIWHVLAKEWIEAQGRPELLRAFINLRLGETWDEGAETIEPSALRARCEVYDRRRPEEITPGTGFEVPMPAAVITASVDVQQDRLEAQVIGFGAGHESWLVDYEIIYGSLLAPDDKRNGDESNAWTELDDWLLRKRRHQSGADLSLDITLIDTGYNTDACYDFILPRQNSVRRVFASKGQEKLPGVGLAKQGTAKNDRIRLFNLHTYALKTRIMDRLRINKPGPGYMHFPEETGEEYFTELTAESRVPVKNKRTGVTNYIWYKNQARNEVLDLTAMNHAGLWILQNILDRQRYADLGVLAETLKAGKAPVAPQAPVRRVLSGGIK